MTMEMTDGMWDMVARDIEVKRKRDNIKRWWTRLANDLTIIPALGEQGQFNDSQVYEITLKGKFKYEGTVKGRSTSSHKQWSEGDFIEGKLATQDGNEFNGSFLPGMKKWNGKYRQHKKIGDVKMELVFEIKHYPDSQMIAQGVREVYQCQGQGRPEKKSLISKYVGRMKNGVADGMGMMKTFGEISLRYEGEFLNDQFHGVGKLVTFGFSKETQDQSVMEGMFDNGQLMKGTISILKYYPASGGFPAQHKIVASESVGINHAPVEVRDNPVSIIQKGELLADYQTSKVRQSRLQDDSAPLTPSTKGLVTDPSPYSSRHSKMNKTAKDSNNPFSRALNIKEREDPNVPNYGDLYL